MKTPKELLHIIRHANDYTYRFNPKTGNFRWREFRGLRDDVYNFWMWLVVWKDMARFVVRDPIGVVKALFRYQWFATYLNYPAFVDRATLGMRGTQLRMARLQYDRIVKIMQDEGWDGYLLSEYEGADKYDPGYEVGQTLRKQHIQLKRLLGD